MGEPYFPPPQKKESAPYRVAAAVPPIAAEPAPAIVRGPATADRPRASERRKTLAETGTDGDGDGDGDGDAEPFLVGVAWRLAAKIVALAATVGILWALVRAHELGAKWPQGVLVVLGIVGIVASPVILYFRLRRIVRFLFARNDDA